MDEKLPHELEILKRSKAEILKLNMNIKTENCNMSNEKDSESLNTEDRSETEEFPSCKTNFWNYLSDKNKNKKEKLKMV